MSNKQLSKSLTLGWQESSTTNFFLICLNLYLATSGINCRG